MSWTERQIHIHFGNNRIIKRKLHRGEVLNYWVTFVTNIYHSSKFIFDPRQMRFGWTLVWWLLNRQLKPHLCPDSLFLVCRLEIKTRLFTFILNFFLVTTNSWKANLFQSSLDMYNIYLRLSEVGNRLWTMKTSEGWMRCRLCDSSWETDSCVQQMCCTVMVRVWNLASIFAPSFLLYVLRHSSFISTLCFI